MNAHINPLLHHSAQTYTHLPLVDSAKPHFSFCKCNSIDPKQQFPVGQQNMRENKMNFQWNIAWDPDDYYCTHNSQTAAFHMCIDAMQIAEQTFQPFGFMFTNQLHFKQHIVAVNLANDWAKWCLLISENSFNSHEIISLQCASRLKFKQTAKILCFNSFFSLNKVDQRW